MYDLTSNASYTSLPTFLTDARALASPYLSLVLVGNKLDLASDGASMARDRLVEIEPSTTPSSMTSLPSSWRPDTATIDHGGGGGGEGDDTVTTAVASGGRDVTTEEASRWASSANIPVAVEVSALSGVNVEEIFVRLARMILTKIELGEVDPDDPQSGIQYGDSGSWEMAGSDDGSIISGMTMLEDASTRAGRRRRKRRTGWRNNGAGARGRWIGALHEWEDVFRVEGGIGRRARAGCCST